MLWLLIIGPLVSFAVYFGYRATSGAPALAERFQFYASSPERSAAAPWWESWQNFLIKPIAPYLERHLPSAYLERVRTQLRQAGFNGQAAFHAYLVIQAIVGLLVGFTGLIPGGVLALPRALACAAVGLWLPRFMLGRLVRKRQAAINGVLPDTMDLLTACVEAGLGLDAAIAQLIRRRSVTCLAINQELSRYLQEVRLGTPRAEALRTLGTRSGIEDLRHVVTALLHGDQLGVGVSQILRAQAQYLRLRRKQRAEEQAMKAPIKILFPLLFGIFPSIFVIILGPAALKLLDQFIGKFQ
jgi:tight adherence protein C